MLDSSSAKPWPLRLPLALLIFAALVLISGCGLFGASKKVQVPQLLSPLAEANKSQLFTEINRMAALQSIHGRVDIQFEDTSFAAAGIAEKYKQADGTVTLQRPGKVYLIVQVPFIAKDIAQMTSDGEHFRVAVLQGDDKYRRFVKGTNSAIYDKLELNGTPTSDKQDKKKQDEKEAVSALSNLRPQHLTDALMLGPVDTSGHIYSQSEFYLEEDDTTPRVKKGTRVVRGYYLLEELTQPNGADTRLRRRFWFDRIGGIRLARLQTFDERGLLTTDVSYREEKPFGDGGQIRLPAIVEITRPHDHYKLSITYQAPASVELNREYRPEAFVLENRWQLPEVDLDARQNKRVTSNQ
jgi:hypothetical protein